MPTIKGQVLYKEGDSADYVFLVKEGQYEVTRTLYLSEDLCEKTKRIFVNPMRANKVTGSSRHSTLKKLKQT